MKATILTLRLATRAHKHHNQLQSKGSVFSPGCGLALLCISTLTVVMQAAEPSGFVEEFNGGTTLGAAHGITYAPAPGGLGAKFRQACESRVEYPFGTRMPTNGTVEFWIKVERGYGYSNGTHYWSDEGAQIFGTDTRVGISRPIREAFSSSVGGVLLSRH